MVQSVAPFEDTGFDISVYDALHLGFATGTLVEPLGGCTERLGSHVSLHIVRFNDAQQLGRVLDARLVSRGKRAHSDASLDV